MTDKIINLQKTLLSDKNLAEKFREVLTGEVVNSSSSDTEAVRTAAAAIGVDISVDEAEKLLASGQQLSEDDLASVTGGVLIPGRHPHNNWDWKKDDPTEAAGGEDGYGHDNSCVAAWHCYAAMLHTDSNSSSTKCWSDYVCFSSGNESKSE